MSKTARLIPPPDLLGQVEGVEETLRRAQKLGAVGWVAFVASVLQVAFLVADSLAGSASRLGSTTWPLALAVVLLALSLILINWRRIWLRESKQPFRYTFSVGEFEPVAGVLSDPRIRWAEVERSKGLAPVDATADAPLAWLRHDLTEKLSDRVRRLSLLEERYSGEVAEPQSHIHIGGSFGVRERRSGWTIEVVPWIRLGPPGSPARLAHAVTFPLGSSGPELDTGAYEKLRERIYFSIATQLYRQVRKDVQAKIDLLPGRSYKAAAYFHEAKDYSRSNTLDAYEQARDLYASVLRLYDPLRWPSAGRSRRRWLRHAAALRPEMALSWRWAAAGFWPRLGRVELMVAKAEIGYANALLDRRMLAGMSGHRLNPVYEALPVARSALRRLEAIPHDVAGRQEAIFDALVTLAATHLTLGSAAEADAYMERAVALDPVHAEQEPRYVYVKGSLEPRPEQAVQFLRRAVELAPNFEAAQFALAIASEMFWRTRPTLERNVAKLVIAEYESVLLLNPGNIAAWANLGYIYWLLEDLPRAEESLLRGRDYKEIQRETFVAELDYGLARIAAERGDFRNAYMHYINAVTALFAQGVSHTLGSRYTSYHFERINRPIVSRFAAYQEGVQREWERVRGLDAAETPRRVVDAVYAFVLNDMGEASFNYFLRSHDERFLGLARGVLEAADRELRTRFALIYLNLANVLSHQGASDEEIERVLERVIEYAPHWPDGRLELALWQARWAREAAERADALGHEAAALKEEAQRDQNEAHELSAQVRDRSHTDAMEPRPDAADAGFWSELLSQVPRPLIAVAEAPDEDGASTDVDRETLERRLSGAGSPFAVWSDHMLRSPVGKADEALRTRAAELRGEAARKLDLAKDRRGEAQHARQRAKRLRTAALDTPASLLPHEWLWEEDRPGYSLELGILTQTDYKLERKLERELDDLHVRALVAWCSYGSTTDGDRGGRAEVLEHLLEHFLPDDFNVLRECRRRSSVRALEAAEGAERSARTLVGAAGIRQRRRAVRIRRQATDQAAQANRHQDRAEACAARMATVIRKWIAYDPAWWSLSWVDPWLATDVPLGDQAELLRSAAEMRGLPDTLYLWIGERLTYLADHAAEGSPPEEPNEESDACREAARAAFANAATSDDPTVLFALAERLASQGLLDESVVVFEQSWELARRPANAITYLPRLEADDYRRAVAAVRWKRGETAAAVDELAAVDAEALSPAVWRAEFVDRLLREDLVDSTERYRALKNWLGSVLTRAEVAGNELVLHDAAEALLGVTRVRYQSVVRRPHDKSFPFEAAGMVPVVPPIIVEADERLLRNAGDHEAIRRVLAETVRHVGERTGVPVPAVQIMSVVDSRPGRYTIRLSDVPTRTGALAPRAGKRGRKFDAIARDLESAVTQNLDAFLGLQVVAALVERWRTHGPGDEADRQRLLARSVPDDAARVLLATILRGLAAEGVPLTDLTPILRALKAASAFPDPIERVEYVRSAVAATLPGLESSRRLLRLPANVEDMVAAGVRSRDGRSFLALPDQDLAAVRLLLADALADADPAGVALVVCTPGLRPFVRKLVALDQPAIPVLALDDVADAQPLPVTRPLGALRPRVVR